MKLLVLDDNYPHSNNLFGDVFVHVRVKEYSKKHDVKVFSFFNSSKKLMYEGISIEILDTPKNLFDAIRNYNPDKILIHFFQSWMLDGIIKEFKIPVIIWVHGYEALGWYRRLFNYTWYSPVLLNYIKFNSIQQYNFRKLIKYANKSKKVRFVFVSNWMRRITEQDTLCKILKYNIIANPIDTELFFYNDKDIELRKKVLILRSFGSRKYANDISVKAILELQKSEYFNQFSFTIIGEGQYFDEVLKPLRNLTNVTIKKGVINQSLIPTLHANHGIFLCPTRQDSQGVSMCEAMSSGLVPITSKNTAIPEFVKNSKTGFLTNTPNQIAESLEQLLLNPNLFREVSKEAAGSIRQMCGINLIIQKEFLIIES